MRRQECFARHITEPDLLQTRAQVAAEHKANPVYFHVMDAGFRIAFLHPLQVGFLLEAKVRTLSGNNVSVYSGRGACYDVDLTTRCHVCHHSLTLIPTAVM